MAPGDTIVGSTPTCTAESCAGFSIAPPNEKGERAFTFAGTILTSSQDDGATTTTLNGVLIQQAISDSLPL